MHTLVNTGNAIATPKHIKTAIASHCSFRNRVLMLTDTPFFPWPGTSTPTTVDFDTGECLSRVKRKKNATRASTETVVDARK